MQERQHRIVRAGAQVGTQHCVQCQCSLQQRRLECLFENVEDVDAGDAQKLAHGIAAETPHVQTQHRRGHQLTAPAPRKPWWPTVVLLSQHARKRQHLRVIFRQGSAVRIRQRSRDERTAIQREMIAIAGEGDSAQVCARNLQAVFRKVELAADARVQQIGKMSACRDAEAGSKLARDGGAADTFRRLYDYRLAARFGEICGAYQAVVARADHDRSISISHPASPRARDWGGADRAEFRALHWRPGPPLRRRPGACRSRTCRSRRPARGTARTRETAG